MFLAAKDGVFNRKAGILTLNNDISLKSSSGYEMKLNEAVVDTATGEVVPTSRSKCITQQATLNADRLEVIKSRRGRPLRRRRGDVPAGPVTPQPVAEKR